MNTQPTTPIRAEQMRALATKNQTSQALMLYFALTNSPSVEFYIPSIIHELEDRGVKVNKDHVYDVLQEIEELGQGSIIYAKNGGIDVFKRDYNLTQYASRAFTSEYLAEWKIQYQQNPNSIKLVDPKIRFNEVEEKTPGKAKKQVTGKIGRPKGYSHKLGRFMTQKEMELRNNKPHYKKAGRPLGWRKVKIQSNAPQGLAASIGELVRKRGRPMSDKSKAILASAPVTRTEPVTQAPLNGNMMSIPLANSKYIQLQIPQNFNKKDLAVLNLVLENMIDNS